MGRFLNSISSSSSVPPGERRFGERLRNLLEDDYLCWHNVPIGPKRQYPDFVVLHPGHGLWVFEVKDWKMESLRMIGNHHVEMITPEGAIKIADSPLEQARAYCMTVVNKLSTDPQLQDPSDRFRGKICFPYAYAAVLTNITRRQLDEALTEDEQDQVLPPRLVICKDEMTESTPADLFQERMWGMFHYRFGQPLSLPQIERVRWHMFPEIRITSVQTTLFSSPPPPEVEETIPEIVKVMDIQQEQLARSLGPGHRVIHGVAGSGKTLILGYRCLHLAATLHKPILVLCFNVTLASRLRSFVNERGIGEKVHVYHFHEWCKDQLATYHAQLIESDAPLYERQVESVIAAVDKGFIPRAQYGAVMIDEGHDFEPEWLRIISQMTDPEADSLLLLYDDAQSIYGKKRGLNFTLSSVGIKAKGRTTILRINYRNTREILRFAYDFAGAYLQNAGSSDEDHIPLVHPESAGNSGPPPEFVTHKTFDDEARHAARKAREWIDAGTAPNHIGILYFQNWQGEALAREFQKLNIPLAHLDKRSTKRAYNPSAPMVSLLTVQSSKGLEFENVIVTGTGHLNFPDPAETARLLYVGMTRARKHLLLSASASNTFTIHLAQLAAEAA